MKPQLITAFSALTTGIYVLTVRDGERRHGMSSSWVTQVSGEPPLLMVAVDRKHFTHDIIARARRFALNVVGDRSRNLEEYFYSGAARRPDNLDRVAWDDSPEGPPLLRAAVVNLVCSVQAEHAAGDHTLFIATIDRVVERGPDRPLTSLDLEYVYVGEVVKRVR